MKNRPIKYCYSVALVSCFPDSNSTSTSCTNDAPSRASPMYEDPKGFFDDLWGFEEELVEVPPFVLNVLGKCLKRSDLSAGMQAQITPT